MASAEAAANGADGMKRVGVIGAGIAGLCTGCYLQMNGYQTRRSIEMHSLPGGLCTSWQREAATRSTAASTG